MITPTVGRMVHVYNHCNTSDQPRSGQIAHVNEDGSVNLIIADELGNVYSAQNIRLVQPGEDRPEHEAHASWMPWQVEQAAHRAAAAAIPDPLPDVSTGPVQLDGEALAKLDTVAEAQEEAQQNADPAAFGQSS